MTVVRVLSLCSLVAATTAFIAGWEDNMARSAASWALAYLLLSIARMVEHESQKP